MLACGNAFAQDKALEISNVRVSGIGQTAFTVSWNTNRPCTGSLAYRNADNDLLNAIQGHDTAVFHSIPVTNLQPGNIYAVKIIAGLGNDTAVTEKFFGTASASTGKITVYFTTPVDTTVSTGTNAIWLNNLADDTLVQYINRSKYSLDICIYNTTNSASIADIAGAINSAYSRGVKVRVIYDGSVGNTMIPNLNAAINRMASPQGSNYNIMHNKFMAIDAKSSNPNDSYVWTGSMNWTVQQINGTDYNNVIIFQDQTLAKAYKMEFDEMWGDTGTVPNFGASKFGQFKSDNTPHIFSIGGKTVESYFSPSDSVNLQILKTISSAGNDMEFETMVITRNDIADSITSKVSKGVFATYGMVDDSTTTLVWPNLKAGMLPNTLQSHTGQTGIMHNKYVIIDQSNTSSDPMVLTGSHNWSLVANTMNDENTVIVHDATIANIYYQEFHKTFTAHGGIMGVNDPIHNEEVKFFPNPAHSDLQVSGLKILRSEVYDVLGTLLQKKESCNDPCHFDLSGLRPGLYFLKVYSAKGLRVSKIIVE